MKTNAMAYTSLLASAFVITAMLFVQLDRQQVGQIAHAGQVVTRGDLTLMTGLTADDEESLFIIDNLNAKMLVFHADVNRQRIELLRLQDLNKIFGNTRSKGRKTYKSR